MSNLRINWDALGISASLACAIHCALLPILMSSLPILGFDIIQNVLFEYIMIGLAFIIGAIALHHGYRRHHHRLLPLALFSAGICFLLAKQAWHSLHIWLLVPAVLLIISAHLLNFRYCRVHQHAHSTDCNH
jgi:tetrahydromethanopterin S-methyltransferase subunit C